jgi:hypothetical protein
VYFTQHAVERFRERFAGGLTFYSARQELIILAKTAVPLRELTGSGEQQWLVTDGVPFLLVCKHDPRSGLVCVTVKPAPESAGPEPDP